MAQWQRTLDLSDVWDKGLERKISVSTLSAIVVERLKALPSFGIRHSSIDEEKENIIEEFKILAEDPTADFDDFDCVLEDLYNWGDISLDGKFAGKKVCWIRTNF